MRRLSMLLLFLLVTVIAVSCGQKVVEEPLTSAPFVTTLADAKLAAAEGKPILLDFFTDT